MKSSNHITIRILPDICFLISHVLSRLILLGHLNRFEIVIPDFVEYTMDVICENRLKSRFYSELDELRKLENYKLITILILWLWKNFTGCRKEIIDLEDEFILEIAVITNSVLLTSDEGLKDESNFIKQSVIYIPANIRKRLKNYQKGFKKKEMKIFFYMIFLIKFCLKHYFFLIVLLYGRS
jgi:predicted PilT family ATPase